MRRLRVRDPASDTLAAFLSHRNSVFYPLAVNIGLRYANSRRSFISFISIVAIAGLVLSVAVLVLVTSVMNGFERELKERVLGVVPHLTVRGVAPLRKTGAPMRRCLPKCRAIVGVAPFIDGTGLLVANGRSSGVTFNGIDPAVEGAVSDIGKYVEQRRHRACWSTAPSACCSAAAWRNISAWP